jgi:hypothetical protein
MQSTTISEHRVSAGKLAFGLALVAVGALSFVDAIDLWEPDRLWRLWPLILIALGVASEIDALRARKSDGGSFLIGIGVWMLAGTQHFFGLTVRTAFPLAVAVVGIGVIVHALVDLPEKKEKDHERNS